MIVPLPNGNPNSILESQQYTPPISSDMFTPLGSMQSFPIMIPQRTLSSISITRIWEHVFADNSAFFVRFHERRKEKDLQVEPWKMSDDRSNGFRFVSLITPCDMPGIGIRPTLLEEAHRFCVVENKAEGSVLFVYHISSQTPKVTAGKTFRTEAVWKITSTSMDAENCAVTIWGNCRKMSMGFMGPVRAMAVPRALREMTAAYKVMLEMFVGEITGTCVDSGSIGAEADAEPLVAMEPEQVAKGIPSEDAQTSGSFQAAVLFLASVTVFLVFMSLNSLRATSVAVRTLIEEPVSAWVGNGRGLRAGGSEMSSVLCGDGSGRSCEDRGYEQGRNGRGGGGYSVFSNGFLESYLDSVNLASNNAEVQSLRYRVVELQRDFRALEREVNKLKWVMYILLISIAFGYGVYYWLKTVAKGREKEAMKND